MSYSLPSLILIFSLLVTASNRIHVFSNQIFTKSVAQTQSPELAEAERLSLQVIELYNKGKYDDALILAERVLALREKALGVDHISIASALANLAELYLAKAKRKEAKAYYERSLAIHDKHSGVDNTGAVKILDRYVCLLAEMTRKDEVVAVRKRLFKLDNGFEYDESSHKALSLPIPRYLPEAKSKRITGSVVAKVQVDETGKVSGVKILCGHPLLVKGAEQAIWNARFQPLVSAGQPVKRIDIITYYFTMD